MIRGTKAVINSSSRFLYEIVAIICSFILPKLILSFYGSDLNGLILSITRFLSISTFIDAAIGGVARAALYKPLADKDNVALSKIYVCANKFYQKVSFIFIGYTLFIACILPIVNNEGFSFSDIFLLTLAISVSTFIQFLIGATNSVLIYADQKIYLTTNINTITLILNTVATAFLIKFGYGIHVVKLTTGAIFALRPIFAHFYCKKHYNIDKNTKYTKDSIPNKWSGFSHQIAETIRNNADIVVLTALSIYSNVSIYAIYTLITDGLTKILECLRSGMGPSFGNMLVTESQEMVRKRFSLFEWVMNICSCILFSCAAILIIPFVMIYTKNVTDANYHQPIFALLIIISTLLHNMKNPYLMIIFAAGHFKQTKNSAYIEMTINIILSTLCVKLWGLNGVAVGTSIAMLFRMIYCALYLKKNIIEYPFKNILIKLAINIGILIGSYFLFKKIRTSVMSSYLQWIPYAALIVGVISLTTLILYSVVFRNDAKAFIKFVKILLKQKSNRKEF